MSRKTLIILIRKPKRKIGENMVHDSSSGFSDGDDDVQIYYEPGKLGNRGWTQEGDNLKNGWRGSIKE